MVSAGGILKFNNYGISLVYALTLSVTVGARSQPSPTLRLVNLLGLIKLAGIMETAAVGVGRRIRVGAST